MKINQNFVFRQFAVFMILVLIASCSSSASTSEVTSVATATSTTAVASTTQSATTNPGQPPSGDQPAGTPPGGENPGEPLSGSGGGSGNQGSVETGTSAYSLSNGESLSGGTYTSTNADENAIRAEGDISATMEGVSVEKTSGDASNSDASSFYGLNAAILALDGATLKITGGSVTASAEGSNGVFAYDGATIEITDTEINVTGGNAGGIEVAGGGNLIATNLTVNAMVKAAIRSDRGGGTLTVNGGTYTTSGSSGAPAVYSTADITVNDATLIANNSEAIVVEGLNQVTLNNCDITGNMEGTYSKTSTENVHNVMLYQSMSGDAEVGTSSFTMTGGSLVSKNGDMFYVTNTNSVISLSSVSLTLADGTYLLRVSGNSSSRGWGQAGANGGDVEFVLTDQTIEGDVFVDAISTLDMQLASNSKFTGSINSVGDAGKLVAVTLDGTSTWILTADSYITAFNGDLNQIVLNGYTLYVNGVAAK